MQREKPLLRYLRSTNCPGVSRYSLLAIDHAMEQAGIGSLSNRQSKAIVVVAKALSKLRLVRNVYRSSTGPVFVSFMGYSESRIVPISCWNEIIPYCFDCWPDLYERWMSFFKRHRVRIALFSARQSARHFAGVLPNMRSVWVPEACDPLEYCSSKSWLERNIDVLELGRRYDYFHSRIREPLAEANRVHLFEQVKGKIIFPDRDGLVDGYARSKISICFPCSQTHPERSGSIETVTLRYFESMASKCIILGRAPQELIDLFGYNPVIEVRDGHEFEQIESLLNSPDSCHDLVELNYRRLMEVGTVKSRVEQILDILRKHTGLS
ncbi:MAG TPA: glycosyltransferase [Terracidiphilus sp.]|nr:glycosyltransferase [Terracidiphilus sp.]